MQSWTLLLPAGNGCGAMKRLLVDCYDLIGNVVRVVCGEAPPHTKKVPLHACRAGSSHSEKVAPHAELGFCT